MRSGGAAATRRRKPRSGDFARLDAASDRDREALERSDREMLRGRTLEEWPAAAASLRANGCLHPMQ